MQECLFCRIAAKTTAAQICYENDLVIAFRDIRPAAPTHALVIPKDHIAGVQDTKPQDSELLGQLLLAAREVAGVLGLSTSGYRLVINQGPDAGQSVFHLHCHVMGGRPMAWPPG
jgi:histidine triad (HIT) family protein